MFFHIFLINFIFILMFKFIIRISNRIKDKHMLYEILDFKKSYISSFSSIPFSNLIFAVNCPILRNYIKI